MATFKFVAGRRYRVINEYQNDEIISRWEDDYPIILSRSEDTAELDDTYWGHVTRKIEHVGNTEVIRNVYRKYGERWDIYADKPHF